MGFLQHLRQLITKPATTEPDRSYGLLKQLGIDSMLAQRQWEQLEATAAQLSPNELTRLLDGLCLTDGYADALARYQQAGQSDLRRLTAAVHATHVAWQIRGGAYAKYLNGKQTEGFNEYLEKAFAQLNQPFASPAYEAERAARTVRVAMGLSEPDLARQAFAHATELVPAHLQAHLFYFNVLTPKWFGSDEEIEEFVEATAAPVVRPLLQAMYAVERLFGAEDGTSLVKQQVRNEVASCLEKLPTQPQPDASLYAIYLNNYQACIYHVLGQPQARNAFLQALGTHITPYPWAYFGLEALEVQQLIRRQK